MTLITQHCESGNECCCPSLRPFAELIPSDGGNKKVVENKNERKGERKRERNDSFEELCKAMAAWKRKMKFIRTLNLN